METAGIDPAQGFNHRLRHAVIAGSMAAAFQ
jgi:hypothetical protein